MAWSIWLYMHLIKWPVEHMGSANGVFLPVKSVIITVEHCMPQFELLVTSLYSQVSYFSMFGTLMENLQLR